MTRTNPIALNWSWTYDLTLRIPRQLAWKPSETKDLQSSISASVWRRVTRLCAKFKDHAREIPLRRVSSRSQDHFRKWRHLTIIPRVRMSYESIAHEAEGRMGYWVIGYEGERNNCFSIIQLVGQKNIETKHLSQVKAGHQSFFTA